MGLRFGVYERIGFGMRLRHTKAVMRKIKVEVKQGVVVGQQHGLPNGEKYDCFKGIPYAQPPVGQLRFKSPVALERFNETELDCSQHRDVCCQRDPLKQMIVGSEDCLFLNVYAPEIERQSTPLPVMVWIHGGGYHFGDGNSDYFLPLTFMQENVIVVTLNYRLNAFGFLCLPEVGVWGNSGLKDQRLALQWTQENIRQFNGDPNNVTLFGESAGASSVHMHVFAQHANKLFHKAILQSAVANNEWVFQINPAYKTRKLAALLGCQAQSPAEIFAFMQSARCTPEALVVNSQAVLKPEERLVGLFFPFKPVIEDSSSQDSFISRPIMMLLQQPNAVQMPLIVGYNSAEGLVMLKNAMRKLEELNRDLGRYVPRNISLTPTDANTLAIAHKMRDFYFRGHAIGLNVLNEFVDLLSDFHFTMDTHKAIEMHSLLQSAPLYLYRFDYTSSRSMYKCLFQLEHLNGACHGDEMGFLFQKEKETPSSLNDDIVTQRMSNLWANFARSGSPGLGWDEARTIGDPSELRYLNMGKDFKMGANPDQNRFEFWRSIYKPYTTVDYSCFSLKS